MKKGRKIALILSSGVVAIALILAASYAFIMWRVISNEDPQFWESAVTRIESRYKGSFPQGAVVFTGSSSIDFWRTLARDMAPLKVLNHGIAGTKTADMTFYAGRLIAPFHPKAVVVYVGSNDVNGMSRYTKSGEEVFRLTVRFLETVRALLPDVPIYYISISPSRARWKVWKDADKANGLIKGYCERSRRITFIDTTPFLLDKGGALKGDIYRWDGLHFNEKGYGIWTSVIRPVLMRDLGK